jgi:hypothetical protein
VKLHDPFSHFYFALWTKIGNIRQGQLPIISDIQDPEENCISKKDLLSNFSGADETFHEWNT